MENCSVQIALMNQMKIQKMCKSNHTCNTGYWKCNDGICIEETYVCNGYFNCDDGSDELNCELLYLS